VGLTTRVISPVSSNSFRRESTDSAWYGTDGVEPLALRRALQIRYDEIEVQPERRSASKNGHLPLQSALTV
jgi:hypothetical protein